MMTMTRKSKVIDINHVKTKEETEIGLKNLQKFYERQHRINNILKKLRNGK